MRHWPSADDRFRPPLSGPGAGRSISGESMTTTEPKLIGLVPDHLKVRSARILLEALAVQADIGFHEFEVGAPQRLLVTAEIWLEDVSPPHDDDPAQAWNYDFLRREVEE